MPKRRQPARAAKNSGATKKSSEDKRLSTVESTIKTVKTSLASNAQRLTIIEQRLLEQPLQPEQPLQLEQPFQLEQPPQLKPDFELFPEIGGYYPALEDNIQHLMINHLMVQWR